MYRKKKRSCVDLLEIVGGGGSMSASNEELRKKILIL